MSRPLYTPVTVLDHNGTPLYRTLMNLGAAHMVTPRDTGAQIRFADNTNYLVRETAEQLERILKRASALHGSLAKDEGETA